MTPHTKAAHKPVNLVDVDWENAIAEMDRRGRKLEEGRIGLFVVKFGFVTIEYDVKEVHTLPEHYASLMTKPPIRRG